MKDKITSVYKYCSSDVGRLILDNNEVLLNNPCNFNDYFDTNIIFNEKDLKRTKTVLINYYADNSMKDLIINHYDNFKWWQKIISFPTKLLVSLQTKCNDINKSWQPLMNYSKLITLFNKLGLKNGKENSDSQKSLEKIVNLISTNEIENKVEREITNKTKQLLITCFSKESNSKLMWAHYADNNKGICLEFENEDFSSVIYSNNRKEFYIKNLMYKIIWKINSKSAETLNEKQLLKYYQDLKPLLYKSKEWEKEKELRCILDSKSSLIINRNGKNFFKMKKLISITLGCSISEEDEYKYTNYAKLNNIRIFKIINSDKSFKSKRVMINN